MSGHSVGLPCQVFGLGCCVVPLIIYQLYFADVHECDENLHDCDLNATCENTIGFFNCHCNSGFNGTGKICDDINECLDNNGGCHRNANCTNTHGSFGCECNPGYSGNGTTCTGIVI